MVTPAIFTPLTRLRKSKERSTGWRARRNGVAAAFFLDTGQSKRTMRFRDGIGLYIGLLYKYK